MLLTSISFLAFALAGVALGTTGPSVPTFHDPDAIRFPLERRGPALTNGDGSINLAALNANVRQTVLKYTRNRQILKKNGVPGVPLSRRDELDDREAGETYGENLKEEGSPSDFGAVPLAHAKAKRLQVRGNTGLYYAKQYTWSSAVRIGTPPQEFNLYLDTGSADLAVGDSTCSATSCGTGKKRYNLTASSTGVNTGKTVQSSYVDGSSNTGAVTKDNFTVALSQVTGQLFIRASSLSSTILGFSVDGMGMSYSSVGTTGGTSVPFTVNTQGGGSYFALRLSDKKGFSELSLGSIDRTRVGGQTHTFPVAKDDSNPSNPQYTFWQIGLSTPNVNGKAVLSSRQTHILDSGSNFIFASPAGAAQFWAAVPGSAMLSGSSTFYTFPCATPPTVSFSFTRAVASSNNYTVAPTDFNLGYVSADSSQCVGAVVSADLGLGSTWLLGSVFMKNWLVLHNMAANTISFATPRDTVAVTPGARK